MDAETKICPHCAETIRAAAKKCPRCRSDLIKPTAGMWFKLAGIYFLVCAPLIIAAWWMRDMRAPGNTIEYYRAQIIVTNTVMHFSKSDNTNIIAVVGYLSNESPYPWDSLQVEVQYFDVNGNLVDTKTETLSGQELPAAATQAFRIRATAAAGEEKYGSHKVFVRTAKDARNIWNPGD